MKKNNILKYLYTFLFILCIIGILYLLIKPKNHEVQYVMYDLDKDVRSNIYGNVLTQKIILEKENTFRVVLFLDNSIVYKDFSIIFYDDKDNVLFEHTYDNYHSYALYFETEPLDVNKEYTLKIIFNNNSNFTLPTVNGNKNSYIVGDNSNSLKIALYNREKYYFYLWYPIFLLVFLITIYPFVWGDKIENKK